MPWPAMNATMSSLSEMRLSGCMDGLLSQKQVWGVHGIGGRFSSGKAVVFAWYTRDIFKESQMIFSKDYVGYLARQTVKHLAAEKMIHTDKPELVRERVAAA